MRKKFYVGAFAMAMASLVAIGANDVKADAAAADAKVEYKCDPNDYTETLEVTDGSEGGGAPYMFYTTTNVTTTIPANSKWTKIAAGDKLDVSSYNGRTVFFFAQSPNPDSVDDILKVVLPAKPALTGLAYKAGATATTTEGVSNIDAAMFSLDKVKVGGEGFSLTKLTADTDIEVAMPALKDAKAALGSQQSAKTYSVVYYNNQDGTVKFGDAPAASNTTGKVKEYCARYEISKSDASEEGKGKWLRPSVPFTLKVAKPAAAPNITFNYANHTMALKKDMQYVSDADFSGVEMGTGAQWADAEAITKITDAKGATETLVAGQKYAVVTVTKNASSIPTYIDVPAIVPFMGAGGAVSVEGTLVENDKDKVILNLGAAGAGSMTYQYKIVDGEVSDFVADDNHFDYAGDDGKGWTNVAVTNTKAVTIAGKSLKGGKKILVRVMKGKTSFSSDVVILCQPENPGEGWELYEPGNDTPIKNATRGEAVYNPKDYTITIPFTGIKGQPAKEDDEEYPSIKLTAGKKSFTVPDGKATWNSGALVIDMSEDEEFKKLDGSTAVTVDIPAGWLIDDMDNVLPAQKITGVNVDNVAPKITSVAMAKDKAGNAILTVTIDSAVKVKQDGEDDVVAGAEVGIEVDKVVTVTPMATIDGDTPAAATGKDDLAIVDSATLKLSGKNSIITLTLANMPTIADKIAGYKVELLGDKVTDLVGNAFAENTNSAIAQNKVAYNKDAQAAVLSVTVSDISGGKVTVTVTSNETLDVKSLTALKNAITPGVGKISGVTWIAQNKSFTFTISGLEAGTTGTLATINATAGDDNNIKDARGFELDATKVEIKASSSTGGDGGDEGGDES